MFDKLSRWWCRHFHTHCHDIYGHCWLCHRGPDITMVIEGDIGPGMVIKGDGDGSENRYRNSD